MSLFRKSSIHPTYENCFIIDTIAGHPVNNEWVGSKGEIGVASFLYSGTTKTPTTQLVVVKHSSQWPHEAYITPEAAFRMALALFDIVEKVKPELIQSASEPIE